MFHRRSKRERGKRRLYRRGAGAQCISHWWDPSFYFPQVLSLTSVCSVQVTRGTFSSCPLCLNLLSRPDSVRDIRGDLEWETRFDIGLAMSG